VLAGSGQQRAVLVEDLIDAAFASAMLDADELPATEQDFQRAVTTGKGEVVSRANELEVIVLGSLRLFAEIRQKLATYDGDSWLDTRADIDAQLKRLWAPGFMRDTPGDWLAQYPRYHKALRTRVERLSGQYDKDRKHTALLQALEQSLLEAQHKRPGLLLLCPAAMVYRWMLEELRVSLFAQNLGTRQAVSQKRLQEKWDEVAAWLGDNPH
jgi:ATP-dependent helicase HrpA